MVENTLTDAQQQLRQESLIFEDICTNPILQSQMTSYQNKLDKVNVPQNAVFTTETPTEEMVFDS